MSGISSPETDSSVYNSALDTTLNNSGKEETFLHVTLEIVFDTLFSFALGEDTSNASINDVSSFKSDLDLSGSTLGDATLGSNDTTPLSDDLESVSKFLSQSQHDNDPLDTSNASSKRSKVNRSLFNDTTNELNGSTGNVLAVSKYNCFDFVIMFLQRDSM